MTETIKTVVISGPFTRDEVALFIAMIRKIDDLNPTATYKLSVHDPDSVSVDAAAFLASVIPPMPGRETSFVAMPVDPTNAVDLGDYWGKARYHYVRLDETWGVRDSTANQVIVKDLGLRQACAAACILNGTPDLALKFL